ncbi:hypothetical protein [Myxococcus sp. Y35]|uniref:hypothetical protein n=1 Tax=Pseudomyxococcus flavus TaxID=3115648 RepID=UPI003CEE8918
MSKIGERLPSIATPKARTEAEGPGTKAVSTQQWVDLLGALIPSPGVTKASAASTFATRATAAVGDAQRAASAQEVLPSSLGLLRDERLARCIDEAFRDIFEGERWPSGPERSKWLGFAKELRAKDPKVTAEQVRSAIANELRLQRDGLDSHSAANTDRFIQDAVKWVSLCYEGRERDATPAEMNHWRDVAARLRREKPDLTPEQLKYAITDAVRAQMTGTDKATPENIDKFIEDAVKWVSLCYEGQERAPTASELQHWRDFAKKHQKENPDLTPEQLKSAITDAIRAKMTGTDKATPENIDKFIEDAVKWVSLCYEGQERTPTASELRHWRDFAKKQLAEKPDMTPEQLKSAIGDAVRAQLTGMDNTGGANIDRFIQEAVQWVSLCYEGQERDATPAELRRWRELAAKKKAEKPDITPEELKYAITDAIRGEVTGTSAPAEQNIDRYIKEAFDWVFQVYRGVPEDTPREPTPRELHEWRQFARAKLNEKPEMTSEDLKYLLLESIRTALANQ